MLCGGDAAPRTEVANGAIAQGRLRPPYGLHSNQLHILYSGLLYKTSPYGLHSNPNLLILYSPSDILSKTSPVRPAQQPRNLLILYSPSDILSKTSPYGLLHSNRKLTHTVQPICHFVQNLPVRPAAQKPKTNSYCPAHLPFCPRPPRTACTATPTYSYCTAHCHFVQDLPVRPAQRPQPTHTVQHIAILSKTSPYGLHSNRKPTYTVQRSFCPKCNRTDSTPKKLHVPYCMN
jgi:hypothetical protein